MDDVRLWIGGVEADLDDDFGVEMNHALEDMTNPAAVRNSWSRTVTLKGTGRNDAIFGHVDRHDRFLKVQDGAPAGIGFNPSARTPFRIDRAGAAVMTGYLQLNDVTADVSGNRSYGCTLYGGVGDFFYTLQTRDDGETRRLSDLVWGVCGDEGEELDPEHEFDFTIDRDFVRDGWDALVMGTVIPRTIHDVLQFAPMYEGIPDSIDAGVTFVAANGEISDTYEGKTTLNGLWKIEGEECDGWAARDLRSYLQRPVIRMRRFFDAVSRPGNNGGYEVELKGGFFSDSNPYWNRAWMTLPLLSTEGAGDGFVRSEYTGGIVPRSWTFSRNVVSCNPNLQLLADNQWFRRSGFGGLTFDASAVAGSEDAEITLSMRMTFTPSSGSTVTAQTLRLAKDSSEATGLRFFLRLTDNTGPDQILMPEAASTGNIFYADSEAGYLSEPYVPVEFRRSGDSYVCVTSSDGDSVHRITVGAERPPLKFGLLLFSNKVAAGSAGTGYGLWDDESGEWVDGTFSISIESGTVTEKSPGEMRSGARISKRILFAEDGDTSVLDILLSYTKRFGLIWSCDMLRKRVTCSSRDAYFGNGNAPDLTPHADLSKDVRTEPLNFGSRFFLLKDGEGTGAWADRYRKLYGLEYGQKRVDTNCRFNDDTEELIPDTVFETLPESCTNASYNRVWRTDAGNQLTAMEATGDRVLKGYSSAGETFEVQAGVPEAASSVWLSKSAGRDFTHFPACAGDDNKAGTLSYALLFYDGYVTPKASDGTTADIYLTDDLPAMYQFGDEPGWLALQSEILNGETVAYRVTDIPHFSRWIESDGAVERSMDYGKPLEIDVPGITYDDGATVYDRFWKAMLSDQFSVNSRTCELDADLQSLGIRDLSEGRFVRWSNCLWFVNAIDGYDVTGDGYGRVTLVKVLDRAAYSDGQDYS